jgi:hypothetical protein
VVLDLDAGDCGLGGSGLEEAAAGGMHLAALGVHPDLVRLDLGAGLLAEDSRVDIRKCAMSRKFSTSRWAEVRTVTAPAVTRRRSGSVNSGISISGRGVSDQLVQTWP